MFNIGNLIEQGPDEVMVLNVSAQIVPKNCLAEIEGYHNSNKYGNIYETYSYPPMLEIIRPSKDSLASSKVVIIPDGIPINGIGKAFIGGIHTIQRSSYSTDVDKGGFLRTKANSWYPEEEEKEEDGIFYVIDFLQFPVNIPSPQTFYAVRSIGGGAVAGGMTKIDYLSITVVGGSSIVGKLHYSGESVTADCFLYFASQLSSCMPPIKTGDSVPVGYLYDRWYCLFPFMSYVVCACKD